MYAVRHPKRLAQSEMRPMEIVIEDLQTNEGIPSRIAFGKGMRFARQRIESITQRPIEPFQVHGSGRSNTAAHCGPDLDRQEASMLIMMLDRLRQRYRVGDDQFASSSSAMTRLGLAIGMRAVCSESFSSHRCTRKVGDGEFVEPSCSPLG